MNSILGPAPVLDFDGTIAKLGVDWPGLRRRLGVNRIHDLWSRGAPGDWEVVAQAEAEAALVAEPLGAVVSALEATDAFAILTSNSERSVRSFLTRRPELAERLAVVVGRETLAGPKSDLDRFRRGLRICTEATAGQRGSGPLVYVGDAPYELEYAARLGARVLSPVDLAGWQ